MQRTEFNSSWDMRIYCDFFYSVFRNTLWGWSAAWVCYPGLLLSVWLVWEWMFILPDKPQSWHAIRCTENRQDKAYDRRKEEWQNSFSPRYSHQASTGKCSLYGLCVIIESLEEWKILVNEDLLKISVFLQMTLIV